MNDNDLEQECTALLLKLCAGLDANIEGNAATDAVLHCHNCGVDHIRAAESVIAFAMAFRLSGNEKWLERARGVATWAIRHQAPDGSWIEAKDSPWNGITIFILLALAGAFDLISGNLAESEAQDWRKAIARGADWVESIRPVSHIRQFALAVGRKARLPGCGARCATTPQFWNTNYIASLPLTLALCGRALGRDYGSKERYFQRYVTHKILDDGLLAGEVNESSPRLAKLFRRTNAIDPGYNLDMSLGVLALYARMKEDKDLLAVVADSATAHLSLLYPDGSVDNSIGARGYKSAYYGSQTAHGVQMLAAGLQGVDAKYGRAGILNARLLTRSLSDNLLRRGPFAAPGASSPCLYPSFARAANLALALMAMPQHESAADTALPCENGQSVWRLPSLNSVVLRCGLMMLTVSGQSRDSSYWPYRFIVPPAGGALTRLYHDEYGMALAAGPLCYQQIEPMHMPGNAQACAAGLQVTRKGRQLSAAHDRYVDLRQQAGGIITARGRVRSRQTWRSGNRYTIEYACTDNCLIKTVTIFDCRADDEIELREPLVVTPGTSITRRAEQAVELQRSGMRLLISVSTDSANSTLVLGEVIDVYAPPIPVRLLRVGLAGIGKLTLRLSFDFSKD